MKWVTKKNYYSIVYARIKQKSALTVADVGGGGQGEMGGKPPPFWRGKTVKIEKGCQHIMAEITLGKLSGQLPHCNF